MKEFTLCFSLLFLLCVCMFILKKSFFCAFFSVVLSGRFLSFFLWLISYFLFLALESEDGCKGSVGRVFTMQIIIVPFV